MVSGKRNFKVSTKLNLVFLLSLLIITGIQTWLHFNTNQQTALSVSIVLTLIAFGVLWVFTYRVVTRSLRKLLEVAQRWREGDFAARVDLHTMDEFQLLGDTYNQLSTELNQSLKGLEKTIAERTLTLQRRARQMQAAAEVGRAAVTIRDLDILLPEATRLISARFDVYHVGIFLLDDEGEYAILRAANSQGGKLLLQEGHKLKIGAQGIVGYVARKGEPRISLEVSADLIHYKNPYLPDTQSEMALPLSVGGKILGVLDVQSTRSSAFSPEDASILQIMADQIAIAIDNAHLLAESRQALEASRRAYGELSRNLWSKFLVARPNLSYIAIKGSNHIIKSQKTWYPELSVAEQSGQIIRADGKSIAIPLKLRNQVIGAFRLQKSPDAGDWTDEEIELIQSISNQVSIALESARLYDNSQRKAERERLAGEITAKVRASNNPQEILKSAVIELRKALNASQAQVIITEASINKEAHTSKKNGNDLVPVPIKQGSD
jgi:GAF domain-containing protein/HAMP domain-containing protein